MSAKAQSLDARRLIIAEDRTFCFLTPGFWPKANHRCGTVTDFHRVPQLSLLPPA